MTDEAQRRITAYWDSVAAEYDRGRGHALRSDAEREAWIAPLRALQPRRGGCGPSGLAALLYAGGAGEAAADARGVVATGTGCTRGDRLRRRPRYRLGGGGADRVRRARCWGRGGAALRGERGGRI